jgi:hypothetical protein
LCGSIWIPRSLTAFVGFPREGSQLTRVQTWSDDHSVTMTGFNAFKTIVSCSAREKSQPRNGAGEIFITAATEIGRETVSATNRFEHETGNPRKFPRK